MRVTTDADELRELRVPTALGAVVTDTAARMWPYKFVAAVLEGLVTSTELLGTFNLQTHTPVDRISPIDGTTTGVTDESLDSPRWVTHTPRGEIRAVNVVLATNAYTSHLLPEFADLIVPCRGQMSALVPPPDASGENRLTSSHGFMGDGQDDYLIQRPTSKGEHLMYGGGRNVGSATISNADDSVLDEEIAKYLRSALPDLLGFKDKSELKAANEWTGVMGFSRDMHPFVGPVPGKPSGLFVSAGYTGHGMPNTWLCGSAVATMIRSGESVEDSVKAAIEETGLPRSYLVTKDRLAKARSLPSVLEQDEVTGFRAEWTT